MEYVQAFLYTFNCILYPWAEIELYYIFALFALLWYAVKMKPQVRYIGIAAMLLTLAGIGVCLTIENPNVIEITGMLVNLLLNIVIAIFVIYNCRKWTMYTWAFAMTGFHAVLTLFALIFRGNQYLWKGGNMKLLYREPRFFTYTLGILLIYYGCRVITKGIRKKTIAGILVALLDVYLSRAETGFKFRYVKYYFNLSYNTIIERIGYLGIVAIIIIAVIFIAIVVKYGRLYDILLTVYIILFQFVVGHLQDPSCWFIFGWVVADCMDERKSKIIDRQKVDGVYVEPERIPLKIAMIGHKRIPSREGGVEIVVEELSKRLVAKGHSVYAYNRKGHHVSGAEHDLVDYDAINEYEGINIIKVPTIERKGIAAFVYTILASIHVVFNDYDVVYYHAEGPAVMCWLPSLFGVPVVGHVHGLDWARKKWKGAASAMIKLGEKAMASQADAIIVLSKHIKNYFWDVYHRKTYYIPNGVLPADIKEPNVITEKYGLKGKDYILYLGRIVPEKGIHYLIKAYKELETEHLTFNQVVYDECVQSEEIGITVDEKAYVDKKLIVPKLIMSGGVSDTGEYYESLKELSEGDKNIIFTGFVSGDEFKELYSNAYIYVLPSDVEGMPLSLLEAMSYGNAVLTSDISECIEVVKEYGLNFEMSNVGSLKEKLKYAFGHTEEMEQLGEEAKKFVMEGHNWDKAAEDVEEVLYRANERRRPKK